MLTDGRIKWRPVVLTFTFSSKDTKGGKDPLIIIRSKLEDLDIKAIQPYVPGKTTHVVAGKRNTAKSLQALIHGTYLVDNRFLSALEYATAPENLNEPESLSPLEADFDEAWPNELEHLPTPGKEPVERPKELFAPDSGRRGIFRGYSFVFFENKQFETLQPPINEAGGKALYFPITSGKTSAAELARHVKDAGTETTSESSNGASQTNAIQVRFAGDKGNEEWSIRVQQQSMVLTGQEMIEQNEFLDAILLKDASRLLRRVPANNTSQEESILTSIRSAPGGTQSRRAASAQNEPSERGSIERRSTQHRSTQSGQSRRQPTEAQPIQDNMSHGQGEPVVEPAKDMPYATRQNRVRGTARRAFTGFIDDDFPNIPQPVDVEHSFNNTSHADLAANSVPEDMEADDRSDTAAEDNVPETRSKKRPGPNDDELFPAQQAVKRRRLEQEREAREKGLPLPSEPQAAKAKPSILPKKKVKQIDVEEALRKRRQAEAEAEEDHEPMHKVLENMTVEDMQRLALVEEIDVVEPRRKTSSTQHQRNGAPSNDRWDDRWNGRKNFKRFRRKDGTGIVAGSRRGQSVIVPLEEVRNTELGVQDDFWAEKEREREARKSKRAAAAAAVAATMTTREASMASRSQSYTDAPSHQEEAVPAELVDGDEPEVIDVDAPRATRQSALGSQVGTSRSQAASRKRPASKSGATSTAKRQRKLNLVANEDEEGSSEEEVPKFRFRKR